jgi:hypothetical protein
MVVPVITADCVALAGEDAGEDDGAGSVHVPVRSGIVAVDEGAVVDAAVVDAAGAVDVLEQPVRMAPSRRRVLAVATMVWGVLFIMDSF